MKKIILAILLVIGFTNVTKAQQESSGTRFSTVQTQALPQGNMFLKNSYSFFNNAPEKDHDFYMHRSKTQRTIGLVLLGGGVLISGVGALLAFDNAEVYNQSRGNTGAALLIVGAAAGIASIPFMILAHASHNKARAMVTTQPTGFGVPSKVSKNITGITMSIPIGK